MTFGRDDFLLLVLSLGNNKHGVLRQSMQKIYWPGGADGKSWSRGMGCGSKVCGSCGFRRQSRRRECHHRGAGDTYWLIEVSRTVAVGGRWVDVEVFAQHFSEQADFAMDKARNRDTHVKRMNLNSLAFRTGCSQSVVMHT